MWTNFDEGVVLFVITLNGENWVSRTTCTDAHLNHLRIEEVSQVLLGNIGGDAADIKTTRLP